MDNALTDLNGQHPFYKISGHNDEPHSDRSLDCIRQGR